MFKNAKTIAPKAAPKGKVKDEVEIPGLKSLAELDALIKALGAMRETLDKEVKDAGFDHMFTNAAGKRPENIKAVDGYATASIEMRKRSTNSSLSEEELSVLGKYDLPTDKVVATPKLFGINPAYAENDELLTKVEEALAGVVPEDFIVLQEERSKTVVTDDTLDQAFAKGVPEEVIRMLTVMAVKPKLAVTDINTILEDVKMMIADPESVVNK